MSLTVLWMHHFAVASSVEFALQSLLSGNKNKSDQEPNMTDSLDSASAADTGNAAGPKVAEGNYPELRLVKAKFFKSQKGQKARCFKAWFEILVPVNGYQAGQIIEYFSKLEFNREISYDKEECARTKQLLGAIFGYGTVAEIDQNIVLSRELVHVGNEDLNPMQGRVVSAALGYKGVFSKWSFAPVLENGQPKEVRPGVKGQTPAPFAAPVAAPAAYVPPPPPVAAPAAPAQPAIPPGWAAHPQAPGWIYNTANAAEMRQLG